MWCDGGGRHWWVLTTWVVVVVCGRVVSVCGRSFSNAGGRFRTWVVVLIRGRLLRDGGGGGLPWPVLVLGCHVAVSDVAPGFPVSKESGGRGCLHTCWWSLGLVTWPLNVVGRSSPLVPLVGGVLSSCRCCGMVVVCCGCGRGESSLSSVMAADVAFLRRSDGVPACPGGCWWWAVVWR